MNNNGMLWHVLSLKRDKEWINRWAAIGLLLPMFSALAAIVTKHDMVVARRGRGVFVPRGTSASGKALTAN